ncbi:hypothetical protein KY289_036212 [Solanum tuberosum]|nr:hypothetical protein KY289_036212 [Solanum tuberosum]
MFTYDLNENVLQAFCENWRPSTNTVSPFIEELYPRLRSLTYIDNQGKYFLPRSCSYLFSTFYRLTKAPSTEFRFENGQSSGLGDRENMLSLHQGCLKVVQNQG